MLNQISKSEITFDCKIPPVREIAKYQSFGFFAEGLVLFLKKKFLTGANYLL